MIADFSQVTVKEVAPNTVQVSGASGKARSGLYKSSIGYRDGFLVEGEISYGGSGALNFVLFDALGGGVTRSLALDRHGKSLSSALLDMEIEERFTGAASKNWEET